MTRRHAGIAVAMRIAGLMVALLLFIAPAAMAQRALAPASSASSMDMPGMSMGDSAPAQTSSTDAAPASVSVADAPAPTPSQASPPHTMFGMLGMDHKSSAKSDPPGSPSIMHMGPMQGGSAPPGARSADYSDGVGYGAMKGMDMQDNAPMAMLLIDQFEVAHGSEANGQNWEAEGWVGNDNDKLWLRTEGERRAGRLEDGDVEALWNHAIAAYWSSQLGVRQDLGVGPGRQWAAFGIQGLSPYWFELEATGYVAEAGRTAARFRAEYEVLFTQRLVLQPALEVNFYGQSDPARRIRSGLSDAQLGLRLRYEITRQFAPYVGLAWTRRFAHAGNFPPDDPSADTADASFERQWTVGVRFWF
jgi:copper resistance protein B